MRAHAVFTVLAAALALRCSAFDTSNAPSSASTDAGGFDPGRTEHADSGPDSTGGPLDGGSDAPNTQSCIFCDDFEAQQLQPRWTSRGPFALDRTLARPPSQQSLRITSSGTDEDQIVGHITSDGKGSWTTYVRYDVDALEALSEPVGLLAVSWGDIFDVDAAFGLAEVVLKSGGLGLVTSRRGISSDTAGVYEAFPPRQWLKVLVRFDFHNGNVTVQVDDKDALSVNGFDFTAPTTLAGGIDLHLGRSQAGPALDVWYDDTSFAE